MVKKARVSPTRVSGFPLGEPWVLDAPGNLACELKATNKKAPILNLQGILLSVNDKKGPDFA